MPYTDIAKRRSYQNAYYRDKYRTDSEYRAKCRTRVDTRNATNVKRVNTLIAQFRANGCLLCSEKTFCCLVAHHVDPRIKTFHIGHARGKKFGHKRVAQELAKCVCLCANCHAKLHAGLVALPFQPLLAHVR
jgi:hypothetical protein